MRRSDERRRHRATKPCQVLVPVVLCSNRLIVLYGSEEMKALFYPTALEVLTFMHKSKLNQLLVGAQVDRIYLKGVDTHVVGCTIPKGIMYLGDLKELEATMPRGSVTASLYVFARLVQPPPSSISIPLSVHFRACVSGQVPLDWRIQNFLFTTLMYNKRLT